MLTTSTSSFAVSCIKTCSLEFSNKSINADNTVPGGRQRGRRLGGVEEAAKGRLWHTAGGIDRQRGRPTDSRTHLAEIVHFKNSRRIFFEVMENFSCCLVVVIISCSFPFQLDHQIAIVGYGQAAALTTLSHNQR